MVKQLVIMGLNHDLLCLEGKGGNATEMSDMVWRGRENASTFGMYHVREYTLVHSGWASISVSFFNC